MSQYEPWRHLLSLGDDVTLSVEPTPGNKPAWWCPESRHILIRPDLNRLERRCHLAHELAHLDLGHGVVRGDATSARTVAREERQADELAARRLISLDALTNALAWMDDTSHVAEAVGVTEHLLNVRVESMYGGERRTVAIELRRRAGED